MNSRRRAALFGGVGYAYAPRPARSHRPGRVLRPWWHGGEPAGFCPDSDVRTYLDDPAGTVTVTKPTVDADHGRIETRTAMVSTDIAWLQEDHHWPRPGHQKIFA